jgi:MFS family permease
MLSHVTDHSAIWFLVVAYVVFGLGFGPLNAPITNSAAAGMPRSQAGVAAAIASTSRQTGTALGVAVLGAAVTSRIKGTFATGFSSASHVGWDIMTGCGVAVFVLGIVTTSAWAHRTAAEAAKLIEADQNLDRGATDYAGVGSRNR